MQILLNVNLSLNQSLLTFLLYVRQASMTQTILEVSLRGVIFLKSKRIVAWALCLENSVGSYVLGQLHFTQCGGTFDYSHADWDALLDHLRNVPWEVIFKLIASTVANGFFDWVQVGIYVYIPHCKYQVKPHSSPWLSTVCAAAIVHRNHFFHFY